VTQSAQYLTLGVGEEIFAAPVENVQEILDCDLKLEMKGLGDLRAAIVHCESVRDFATRDLLSDILDNEEDAVDFIETQLELITLTGLENYIQLQSGSAEHGSS